MELRRNKKRKGFTLVELIVVIAIMLVLAVVAGVAIGGIIASANTASARSDATILAQSLNNFNALVTAPATRVTNLTGTGNGVTIDSRRGGTNNTAPLINLNISGPGGTAPETTPAAVPGILFMTHSVTLPVDRVEDLLDETGLHGIRLVPATDVNGTWTVVDIP
jgi:prepilin-type N-terminal cleavage/methylation domain-containing protein